ncbi:MAG: hypothetical protein GY749_20375 [Desulfobacteraceae bacterium]|nr:hypothetical protein [Desulfobacteraceae bacterium]
MFDIKADVNKNCLFITLKGFLKDDEMKQAADSVIKEAGKLKKGFTVINNISESSPTSKKGAEEIQKAQQALSKHGVKKVIRVCDPDNVLSKWQFEKTQKDSGSEYETITVNNMHEAMKLI